MKTKESEEIICDNGLESQNEDNIKSNIKKDSGDTKHESNDINSDKIKSVDEQKSDQKNRRPKKRFSKKPENLQGKNNTEKSNDKVNKNTSEDPEDSEENKVQDISKRIRQSYPVPKGDVALIIGKQGSVINKIQKESNTFIYVNENTNNNEWKYLSIQGFPNCIDCAKKRILSVLIDKYQKLGYNEGYNKGYYEGKNDVQRHEN